MLWTSRTHTAISSPLASLRIGTEVWMECSRSERRIALGPRGRRRGAQGFGAARASALRQLTSRRLSERSEQSERSEFGARPQTPSTAEQSALGRPPPSGRLFFGDFLLAKQKKVTALSGAHPDAASRSEQNQRQSEASIHEADPVLRSKGQPEQAREFTQSTPPPPRPDSSSDPKTDRSSHTSCRSPPCPHCS